MPAATFRYAVSWSGGKDSALALNRAWRAMGAPAALLTMMIEDGSRSRSHGLRPEVLDLQGALLSAPVIRHSTSWSDYEKQFSSEAIRLREQGVRAMVFGDIDLEDHRDWCVRVCTAVGLQAIHPLWQEPRISLINEFLQSGFAATLIAVKDGVLTQGALGMELQFRATRDLIVEAGADLCGENGEYHTLVTVMPQFREALTPTYGSPILRDGYWFIDAAI
jgi:diphthine-ammonia ligase